MRKNKASYTYTHKRILVHLLPLSLFLFSNCDTKLDLAYIPVDSELAEPIIVQTYTSTITYGEEEMKDVLLKGHTDEDDTKPLSSSGKRKRIVLSNQDKAEPGPVVKKTNQECYLEQGEEGFSNLPIELRAYILSFLDQKNFHRASLVCQDWREAALVVGEEKTLDLSKRKLDEKDYQALLQVPFCSLILKECGLGDQGVLILSQSPRIKHLDLSEVFCSKNKIGDAGAQALASGNLSALTSLNLRLNNIGDAGAQALARGNLSALTSLDLGYNKIGASGAQALASGNLSALTSLDLADNKIREAGAQALASGNLAALTSLDLYFNSIGASGAQALASGNLSALTSLNLILNGIMDAGAQALTSGNLSSLTSLNLRKNVIGRGNRKTLKTWAEKKLIKLDLK